MAKRAGSKSGGELERLVEAWLQIAGWKTHRAAAVLVRLPSGKSFSKSHDLFGVFDFVACRRAEPANLDGHPETWAIQTTSPATRSVRRDKIAAAGPWPRSWRVSILHHLSARVGRETLHWFVFEDYEDGVWSEPVKVEISVKALEAYRSFASKARKTKRQEAAT